MSEEDVTCPHCHEPLGLNVVSKAKDRSRVSVTYTPEKGQFMGLRSVSESLTAFAKLMDALAAESEGDRNLVAMLESVECGADNSLKFNVLFAVGRKRRKKRR